MRILIIDRLLSKTKWIKEILEERQIEYEHVTYLEEAYQKILGENVYDGIIVDMKFPVSLEEAPVQDNAGETLLKCLNYKQINIPILGNSYMSFSEEVQGYESYKGNLYGNQTNYAKNKLIKFLNSIEQKVQ